ncbi:hypothetical protein N7454_010128 [Penicillium verhagenii]|nr:hypothetical protein N7454_010128 [Penicillium verhagenii]
MSASHPELPDPQNAKRATPSISADNATLHLGSSVFIAAPSTKVWEALMDTSTWPTWNEFVPRVTIRSQPSSTDADAAAGEAETGANTNLSPILQKGTRMIFHVRMDPSSTKPQKAADTFLVVTEVEPPNAETGTAGRIVWVADWEAAGGYSPKYLVAEREHEIKDVEGGTEVRNWENQTGWLVYAVRFMYAQKLADNFELWVWNLKRFVEGQK